MAAPEAEGMVLPIRWHVPEDIAVQYATNMVVQHSENEFIMSFFRILPPIILGEPEAQLAQLEGLEEIRAECVARVIVAADRMPEFVDTLRENLERYRSRAEDEE